MRAIAATIITALLSVTALGQQAAMNYGTYDHKVKKPPTSSGSSYDYDFTGLSIGGLAAGAGGSNTQFQYNSSGVLAGTTQLTISAGVITEQAGNKLNLVDPTDTSKKVQLDLSGISTGTTRTVKILNQNSSTVNAGGTTGQVLTKASNTDFDFIWQTAPTTGASTADHFVTTQAEADLSNEFSLGALGNGLIRNVVSGGVAAPVISDFDENVAGGGTFTYSQDSNTSFNVINTNAGTSANASIEMQVSGDNASIFKYPANAVAHASDLLIDHGALGRTVFSNLGAISIPSATNATNDQVAVPSQTIAVSGTTHVTTAKGFNEISIYKPTYTDSSAVTIDRGATLYIEDAPVASGSLTLTSPYALWVAAGNVRFGSLAAGITKSDANGVLGLATAKTDYWDTSDFVASGASHAHGLVPDPGASAGTTKFLREDATWAAPSSGGASTADHFVTTQAESDLSNEFSLGSLTSGLLKHTVSAGVSTPATATAKTDYWDTSDFVASGASHAHGLVPDPGASAGTTKFLREDATFAVPPATGARAPSVTGHGDSAYTILSTDYFVYTNANFTASRVWTMPAASSLAAGDKITVYDAQKTTTTTNFLQINRAGSDLFVCSGVAATATYLSGSGSAKTFISDGSSKWFVEQTNFGNPSTNNRFIQVDSQGDINLSEWQLPDPPAGSSHLLKSLGTDSSSWTTTTWPDTGTTGKVVVGNGTNYVESTPTFPTGASATNKKIIKSDGTNWVASTSTEDEPGTAGNTLRSDGTNWVATDQASWDGEACVITNDYTSTTNSLADITGMVTPTLSNSTLYEIEADIYASCSGTGGLKWAIHGAGTGSAATGSVAGSTVLATANATPITIILTAVDTASAATHTIGTSTLGALTLKGFMVTTSTGTATLSIQGQPVTSGQTFTVKKGSCLKYRKAKIS